MSDKATYGYLAGIIDGEGTISITRGDAPVRKWGKSRRPDLIYNNVRFSLRISIKNTDERLMRWLKERFRGEYYPDKSSQKEHPNWKVSHVWIALSTVNKESFLLSILPYLIIKREQALVALEFLRLGSERDREKRQSLYERITTLNKRGKLVETNTLDSPQGEMIESVLIGNNESTPVVTQTV